MQQFLDPSWYKQLQSQFEKPYFQALSTFVTSAYETNLCFPPKNQIFSALNYCPFNKVKVVIIGQDPYHDNGQANGLCFSVNKGIKIPPSLVNIYQELATDVDFRIPDHGDLSSWARQGVLLLNDTLTVQAHKAGSHQKQGWSIFTDHIIELLSEAQEGLVFMLWGGFAQKKGKLIDRQKHLVLTAGHPSPLSANRGYWFGNKHFSKCNHYLVERGKKPIDWSLEQAQGLLFT
jgi:uracil-DNA glycosylase